METFVVRVWVPDRPGALGQVASRIGAVRGDVVGIDILERGAGRAIDELVVELPDAGLVSLLLAEIDQVDGVDVEDVRPAPDQYADPRLDALETAALIVGSGSYRELLSSLVTHARQDLAAEWAVVIDLDEQVLRASHGAPPPPSWLAAFVAGSETSAAVCSGECGPDDVAWASLGTSRMALLLGRQGRPFRARERHQLAALCRIAQYVMANLGVDRATLPVPLPAG